MANPALRNGYMSLAVELVEVLMRTNIPGGEMRIIWAVWRKTWCWKEGNRHKDWDWISLSQFEKMTGMKHSNCVREIQSLVVKKILLHKKKLYSFNQNYEDWVVVKRIPPPWVVVKRILGSSQKDTKISSQKDTNKRNKETNTKERIATQSSLSDKNTKNMKTYSESNHSDCDIPVVDLETGQIPVPEKKVPKNKLALRAQDYFIEIAKKNGLPAIKSLDGYVLIVGSMKKANLDAKLLKQRIDDWFASGIPAENMVSINKCFSNHSIEQWKVINGLK